MARPARSASKAGAVKGPDAFRTISEAADEVGAPQHVLRFWETKFTFISPMKRAGGRRFYRSQDIVLLKAVRRLLHEDGLTIRGVQRLYREGGAPALTGDVAAPVAAEAMSIQAGSVEAADIPRLLADLERAKARLDAVLTT
jgi:DNA-binding transcriptional MerR regulator